MNENANESAAENRVWEAASSGEGGARALLEAALDCVILMDHQGKVVTFNPAAERTFGYRRDEVIGREMAALLIPPAFRDRHRQGLARYLATGEGPLLGTRLQVSAVRADGTEFPVELTITRLPSDGPPLFAGFLRDITEQRRAERRLAAQHAVSQVLSEAPRTDDMAAQVLAAIGQTMDWQVGAFWLIDPEQQALRCQTVWSSASTDAEGFEAATRAAVFGPGVGLPGRVWAAGQALWVADILTLPNFPRCHAAHAQGLRTALAFPARSGKEILGVIEFFRREMGPADAELLRVIEGIGSQIGQFLQRTRAEEALRRQEARFRLLVQNSADIITVFDAAGTLLYQSASIQGVLGHRPEERIGRNVFRDPLVHPDDTEAKKAFFEQALASPGGEVRGEFRLRHTDGSWRTIEAVGRNLLSDPNIGGIVANYRDITERKRLEERLQEAYRKEHHIAETLQKSLLLAPAPDAFPGLTVKPLYRPASNDALIGGDFFDIFAVAKNKVALVVGDVTGKGLEAATYTAEIKYPLRAFLREFDSPAIALEWLNRFVAETKQLDWPHLGVTYTSMGVVVVDTQSGEAVYSSAGMEPPFLIRAGTGEAVEMAAGGPLLGAVETAEYETGRTRMDPGDLLVIATDGITEARRGNEFFGYEGLIQAVRESAHLESLEEIGQGVARQAREFAGNQYQDDVCLLIARRRSDAGGNAG